MKRAIVIGSFTTFCEFPTFSNDDLTTFSTWLSLVKVLSYPLLKQWISEWTVALAWPRNALEMKTPDLTLFYWMEKLYVACIVCIEQSAWVIQLFTTVWELVFQRDVEFHWKCFAKSCTKEMQLIFSKLAIILL